MQEFEEYIKPSRKFGAKNSHRINKPKTHRDRKKDYTRKGKEKWYVDNQGIN